MLAAIDDESDLETNTEAAFHESNLLGSGPTTKISTDTNLSLHESREDYAEDEESDIVPVQPRGRIAARLQEYSTTGRTSTANEEHATAYQRIRSQILGEPLKRAQRVLPDSMISGPEDDDEPLRACRRIERVTKDLSQSQSPSRRQNTSQRSSPGLFVSRKPASSPAHFGNSDHKDTSDSDLPPDPRTSNKVLRLVAQERAKREAREGGENRSRATKKSTGCSRPTSLAESEGDIDDKEGESRLTQQTRPARKASKKALEEMNRETQRMSRNMQLAHQARTRKKVTKESLFARFKFRGVNLPSEGIIDIGKSSTAASSAPASELEDANAGETPPSSPPQSVGDSKVPEHSTNLPELNQSSIMDALNFGIKGSTTDMSLPHKQSSQDEFPTMFEIVNPPENQIDKGQITMTESSRKQMNERGIAQASKIGSGVVPTQPSTRVQLQRWPVVEKNGRDSDSDLEIVPMKMSKNLKANVFDRLPAGSASEGRSLRTLRALAHLTSPGKHGTRSQVSMSLSEMQLSLQKRARQQAAAERAEKIQGLKARGVIVQTAEEREKDQVEVENLLEKARMEAQQIKQKEKQAARKKDVDGQLDVLPDTSDEDADYQDDEVDNSDIELSGSEEEGFGEDEHDNTRMEAGLDVESDDETGGTDPADDTSRREALIKTEANQNSIGEYADISMNDEDIDQELDELPVQRKRRCNRIIDEDDDEDDQPNASQTQSESTKAMHNPLLLEPLMPAGPGIGILGMTQAFAATMAESQTQALGGFPSEEQDQDSLDFLGPMPEPDFPIFPLECSQPIVMDSQTCRQQDSTGTLSTDIQLHLSQLQTQESGMEDTQAPPPTPTQCSDIPDPTQDVGFALSSPGPEQRFVSVPPSTVDTVILSRGSGQEMPKALRKGRIRRRIVATADESNDEANAVNGKDNAEFQISANAFDVLKKTKGKQSRTVDIFDKKKSNAKAMVEEQAQESEDEYAGIGGASDDESSGGDDEEVRKIIDVGEVDVDEGELAAFYA